MGLVRGGDEEEWCGKLRRSLIWAVDRYPGREPRVTPILFAQTVWLCAGLSPLWPWTITGRYTGSPAVRFAKRAYGRATR